MKRTSQAQSRLDENDLAPHESSFLQGLLSHLAAVCAFTLPLPASYDRVADGVWSGGTWVAWGRENKECPVRLCGLPGNWNFEVKTVDATANPYLALSAILSAGLLGIQQNSPLIIRDPRKVPSVLNEQERKLAGITTRMPLSISESQKALKKDTDIIKAMGANLVETHLIMTSVRRLYLAPV